MSVRIERVNQLLREEISDLVRHHLKDPRIGSLLSITEVVTSPDLGHAKVYVSVMAPPQEQDPVLQGLASATGFLRHELRPRLRLRRIPELHFLLDTSIQRGGEMLELIKRAAEPPSPPREVGP